MNFKTAKHVMEQQFINGSTIFQQIKSAVHNPLDFLVLIFSSFKSYFGNYNLKKIQLESVCKASIVSTNAMN